MAATSGQQIWPMLPRAHSNFQPVKDFSRITAKQNLTGILLTLWDDTSPHFETFWRGIYNFALFSWNYQDIKMEDAYARFRHRFYGPKLFSSQFAFQDRLEESARFWETALIEKGDRDNYPAQINSIALPAENEKGVWSTKNAKKLAAAKNQVKQYESTKQTISKALQNAIRNRYALEIFQQLNELQVYPAKLLLKLEQYDKAESPEKSKAAKEVSEYAQSFDALRRSYEQLTTRTRVLQNPNDYVPDQNHHHHLANGTNNSDWMYVYELALNKSIQEKFSN